MMAAASTIFTSRAITSASTAAEAINLVLLIRVSRSKSNYGQYCIRWVLNIYEKVWHFVCVDVYADGGI